MGRNGRGWAGGFGRRWRLSRRIRRAGTSRCLRRTRTRRRIRRASPSASAERSRQSPRAHHQVAFHQVVHPFELWRAAFHSHCPLFRSLPIPAFGNRQLVRRSLGVGGSAIKLRHLLSNRVPYQNPNDGPHHKQQHECALDERNSHMGTRTAGADTLPAGMIDRLNLRSGMDWPRLDHLFPQVKSHGARLDCRRGNSPSISGSLQHTDSLDTWERKLYRRREWSVVFKFSEGETRWRPVNFRRVLRQPSSHFPPHG